MTARLLSLPARVAEKIDASGECWLWTGATNRHGYAHVRYEGRVARAHRVVYQLLVGPIPAGRDLDHICRVRLCVNPEHLRPLTRAENMQNLGGAYRTSKSGIRGVVKDADADIWRVYVRKNGRLHSGGRFTDIDQAREAAIALRAQLFDYSTEEQTA